MIREESQIPNFQFYDFDNQAIAATIFLIVADDS